MRRFTPFILSSVSIAALAATPAFAAAQPNTAPTPLPDQQNPPPCPVGSTAANCVPVTPQGAPATESNSNAIVVTGSRIQRPNLQSPVPITSISQGELTNQGQVSVGDALNDLPALRSTFTQQNSGLNIGTAGQNFLDLRGLGVTRTLVLVDGRRFVTGSVGNFVVDVDDIPQELIDRVDIVTGGESAVYGSDAVAGVVNFILKKDFDGFRIHTQAGISKYGDRPIDYIAGTYGRNFGDGRGNVALSVEYTHAGELFLRDRDHFATPCGFEPNPADNGGQDDPSGPTVSDSTNGIPDNIFVCGLRNPFVTNGGSIGTIFSTGQDVSFDPTGNLVFSSVPTQNFINLGGTVQSNDPLGGSTLNETGDLAIGQDRLGGTLLAHFDVSDALKPFIQGTYVHQKAFQEGQPTFFQGDLNSFFENAFGANVPSLQCSNPFLTAGALATLSGFGFCGVDEAGNTVGIIPIDRFNVDFGARQEIDTRKTYRIVAGVTGDFSNNWHYEVSFNYGHTKQDNAQANDLLLRDVNGHPAGFALAIDAVSVDPNGNILQPGQAGFGDKIVCRSSIADPSNGCVPINIFGEGQPSQAALNFVNRTSNLFESATEQDFLAFLSGDSGNWFSLQGGPIGFSVGVEHRRETAEQHADPVSASGGTFFNAFPEFAPPAFKVSEAFGELSVPILKDLPFVHELTVSGAARYSHYNLTGNTFAWNANAIWAPARDLRLRANYSKSVRAPTLGDLFQSPTVNFAFITDPCDAFNINTNPNFAANCKAAGVPTTVTSEASPCFFPTQNGFRGPVGSPFHNCLADSFTLQVQDKGNVNLKAETGKSLTLGGVFTPRFIPGFSLSVDYFDIRVSNLISQLGANTIVQQCFKAPTLENSFCPFIFPRDQFGLFASPAAIETNFNFAKQTSRGIDFDLAYRHTFGNGHRLNLRGIATYTINRMNFTDITNPKLGTRQLSTLGDPVFSGTLISDYGVGKFDLRYTLRFIGSMTNRVFEDIHPQPTACTDASGTLLCPPFNSDVADPLNTGPVWYHDVRVNYTLKNYQFYVGVDNVLNRLPPLGFTGSGAGSSIYSNLGRFFYGGAVIDIK